MTAKSSFRVFKVFFKKDFSFLSNSWPTQSLIIKPSSPSKKFYLRTLSLCQKIVINCHISSSMLANISSLIISNMVLWCFSTILHFKRMCCRVSLSQVLNSLQIQSLWFLHSKSVAKFKQPILALNLYRVRQCKPTTKLYYYYQHVNRIRTIWNSTKY